MIVFSSRGSPFASERRDLLNAVRDLLDTISKGGGNEYFDELYFYGPGVGEADAEALTMQRFPWVMLSCVVLVFTMVAVRFQSAFMPFKLSLTMVVPIMFVYGVCSVILKHKVLNIPCLQFAEPGYSSLLCLCLIRVV